MKTINDIKDLVNAMDIKYIEKRGKDILAFQGKLFKQYDNVEEIQKLLSDLENVVNGEYSINEYGLEYQIEISEDIQTLPEIEDYLTRDFGYYREDESILCQSMGDYIGVNHSGDSRSYFVFDSGTRKEIVKVSDILEEGHPDISENEYISAKIALYQIDNGEFNDVIEVDYYGGYVKHFDFEGIKDFEDKFELLKIIDEYENYNNEDEEN